MYDSHEQKYTITSEESYKTQKNVPSTFKNIQRFYRWNLKETKKELVIETRIAPV